MTELGRTSEFYEEKRPASKFAAMLLVLVGGYLLANAVSVFLVAALMRISPLTLTAYFQNPGAYPDAREAILLLQGIAALLSFIITPILYWTRVDRRPLTDLSPNRHLGLFPVLAVVLLVVVFVPFNDLVIQWNQSLQLPEWLQGLESWMREKEDSLREITELLTDFKTVAQLLLGFLVIAVIPGVGEELLFRGTLQNRLLSLFRNEHGAIWVAAAVFSAIHFQFYGFIPRMLLGALFGYVYVWSGNIWLPMLAHFVNNGFTLLMVYLYRQKLSQVDVEKSPFASLPLAMLSLVLTLGLLFYLKNYYTQQRLGKKA